jgi:signal transduction histidine kinase
MKKILAGVLAIVVLVTATTATVIQIDERLAVSRQTQVLDDLGKDLEMRFFLRHRTELAWLAGQASVQEFLVKEGPPPASLMATLEQARGLLDLEVVNLVDARGVLCASSDPARRGLDLSSREGFSEGMRGRIHYGLVQSGGPAQGLYASAPVVIQGRIVGLVSFRTAAAQLELALSSVPGVLLFDPEGKMFSSDPTLARNFFSWVWDGPRRVFASGKWNRVSRHALAAVPGFTLISFEPETRPWWTLLILNFIWVLLVLTGLSVWHQGRLARERKAEQRSRHERELLLANLLEGIAVLDVDGRLLWANPAFHRLVQTDSPGTRQSIADWWDPPGEGLWRDVLEGRRPWVVFESILRGHQGAWTPVLAGFTAAEGQYLLSVLDRSESHRSDQLLRQSQKLSVLGQLSGGIAHDLNNMLGVLMGMADLIKLTLSRQDPLQESVDLMLQTLTRAAGLAEKMLDFARQTPSARLPVDLTAVLRELQFLARTALPSTVTASFVIPPGPLVVLGDENLLLSALLNLVINAGEALPRGGEVRVRCVLAGLQAEVTVEDGGLGMDAETLSRIFEPFFSTKLEKKGTGLGLSLVRRTILEHQGNIAVKSSPGKGTQITIVLPVQAADKK